MNSNPEQKDEEVAVQHVPTGPSKTIEDSINDKLNALRLKKGHGEMLEIENDIKKIMGMYASRINRKTEIINALVDGKKPPKDTGIFDSTWREKYETLKTKLDKSFTVIGRSEYGDLIKDLDYYREEQTALLKEYDEKIADIKAEKKGKTRDNAKADKIRESLKKAA